MTEFCQSLGVNQERETNQALPAETTLSMDTNTLDCLETIDNFNLGSKLLIILFTIVFLERI